MTSLVADGITRLLPRASAAHLIIGEVAAAQGIADVVAVRFDTGALRVRLDGGVGPLCSPLRVRALDLLRNDRGIRASSLARKLGSNERALTRSTLGPLAELGVVEVSRGMVRSTGAWRPVASQLTAIELKLSDWRGALRQADNFALSADWTWVVLDQFLFWRATANKVEEFPGRIVPRRRVSVRPRFARRLEDVNPPEAKLRHQRFGRRHERAAVKQACKDLGRWLRSPALRA